MTFSWENGVEKERPKSGIPAVDWSELEEMWERRRKRAEAGRQRDDPAGMTKPARDPDEAAFLRERGLEGPFTEVEMPGWKEWLEKRIRPWEKEK
jgi:hypothetical protein